jgi:hypothetical protein
MNVFIIFGVFLILGPALFFTNFNTSDFEDLQIRNETIIYVGLDEPCVGLSVRTYCLEGYKCVLTSTFPEETGICMELNATLEQDEVNRPQLGFNYSLEIRN